MVGEHCLLTFPVLWAAFEASAALRGEFPLSAQLLAFTPLKLLWAGGPAVVIFFVLSGLVLSLPFWSGRAPPYRGYAIRRLFRLYPVYLVALGLALLLYDAAGPIARTDLSGWTAQAWSGSVTVTDVVRAALFMPSWFLSVDAALWTLVHEMRIALIYPLLLLGMARWPRLALILSLGASLAAVVIARQPGLMPDVANLLETVAQVWLFVAGGLIGRYLPQLRARLASVPTALVAAAVALCAVLLAARFMFPLPEALSYFTTRGGAIALVILVAADRRVAGAFAAPIPVFLGTISYTVYAVHFPILFAALAISGVLPPALVLPLAVGVAIAVAYGITRLIEVPFIGIGRQLARAVEAGGARRSHGVTEPYLRRLVLSPHKAALAKGE